CPVLVIRFLIPLQFFVEQRGEVLFGTVSAAAAPVGLLGHLPPPYFGLRLQQAVERRHLVRQRVLRTVRRKLLERFLHSGDRIRDRIVAARRLDGGIRPEPLRRGAPRPAPPP